MSMLRIGSWALTAMFSCEQHASSPVPSRPRLRVHLPGKVPEVQNIPEEEDVPDGDQARAIAGIKRTISPPRPGMGSEGSLHASEEQNCVRSLPVGS